MTKKVTVFGTVAVLAAAVCMSSRANGIAATAQDNDTLSSAKQLFAPDDKSIVDEVIWVVGDEAILKSDVEAMRLQSEAEGVRFKGNPDCAIPEQIAVQKLFLHQAAIDSIEVSEAEVAQGVDEQINYWINLIGSREKLEEYRKMSINQIREQMHDDFKNSQLVRKMKEKLVEDVSVTPADVRDYFRSMPADSIPYVPMEVEVEIITRKPKVSQEEIDRIKDELRDYTERVTNGTSSFSTLARLYSDDTESARQGGEIGYTGRGVLDQAFANVAFNLTDPKKISKIVESEFGYHIIQLIDKRGDKVNVRHILKIPKVTTEATEQEVNRLDSLADEIRAGKYAFEDVAGYVSDDKDTKNNKGVMVNNVDHSLTSRFQMKDLPTEVARVVEGLKVGEISKAFTMVNKNGKTQAAIVKLKSRTDGHRATITEDFQVMKNMVLNKEREKVIHDWIVEKIKKTYVRMKDKYKDCEFEYEGWVK